MKPVALVTGANRGIGLAIARELSRTHVVWVGGRDEAQVRRVVAELPEARAFVAELADPEAVAAAVAQLERLDVVVHSAGVAPYGELAEASWASWQETFAVNVFAVAELTRLVLPRLRETSGHVITINSGSGLRSHPHSGVYCASKFALTAFTDALREEESGRVRVTSVHPGRVDTQMQVELQANMGNHHYDGSRYVSPESIARAVRLAVDTTAEANIDVVTVRPTRN